MDRPAFIGDEVTAAGFRLAGLEVASPAPQATPEVFADLAGRTDLLLLTADAAANLPEGTLRRVMLAGHPLVLVVPDARGRFAPPDIAANLKRQLGLAE